MGKIKPKTQQKNIPKRSSKSKKATYRKTNKSQKKPKNKSLGTRKKTRGKIQRKVVATSSFTKPENIHFGCNVSAQQVVKIEELLDLLDRFQISGLERLSLPNCFFGRSNTAKIVRRLKKLQQPMKELDLTWNSIGKATANAITKVLHMIEALKLESCKIDSEIVEAIGKTIESSSHSSQMNELDLSNNLIGADGACHIAKALHRLSTLKLSDCFIEDIGAKAIGNALSKSHTKMNELALARNNIGDDGACHLAKGLHRVSTLNLNDNLISEVGAKAIGDSLSKLSTTMNELELSGNCNICDAGACHLAGGLHRVSTLKLMICNITESGTKAIGEALAKLPYKMNQLDLGYNEIGDDGVRHLAEGLHRVSTLKLMQCYITDEGAKTIGEALALLPEKMNEIDLLNNEIDDDGVCHLAKGLHRVSKLNLRECNITDVGAKVIGESLALLQNKINEIDLTDNKIGDDGARHLARGLHRVSTLTLYQCNITAVGAKAIGDALASLPNKMNELDLSWNEDIGDDGVCHLARGLHRVSKLKLEGCNITNVGAKAISNALQKLPENMNELDLTLNEIDDEGARHLAIAKGLHRVSVLDLKCRNMTAVGAKAIGDALALLPKQRHHVKLGNQCYT